MAEHDFFRTEFALRWSANTPSLYGFNGITFFSSLANLNTTHFLEGLGLSGWDRGNRFYYAETSPLTNAFLSMRYLISRTGTPVDDGIFWERIATSGDSVLLRNNRYLPFGFMVGGAVADFVGDRTNPMNSQNNLFRMATGLDAYLFTTLDISRTSSESYNVRRISDGEFRFDIIEGQPTSTVRFYYEIPIDGLLYVYVNITGANYARVITGEGIQLQNNSIHRPYIFFAGDFLQGEIIVIEADTTVAHGMASIHAGILDRELFDYGFEILSAETLNLTRFTDTNIVGDITVSQRRLLYTSLPHAGNWRVFVNGARQEIVSIDGAMAAVWLDPGENVVEFRHFNAGFVVGAVISSVSLLIFLVFVFFHNNRRGVTRNEDN